MTGLSPTRILAALAMLAALLPLSAFAGECAAQIDQTQAQVDKYIESVAAMGPTAPESPDALLNRQPTPDSLAQEEDSLGEGGKADAALAAIEAARAADAAGDLPGCQQQLEKARALIGM